MKRIETYALGNRHPCDVHGLDGDARIALIVGTHHVLLCDRCCRELKSALSDDKTGTPMKAEES